MDDLPELPPKFQNRFEKAKAEAEREYASRTARFPHSDSPLHNLKLIQDVFFGYCAQARDACRAGAWTLALTRRSTDAALPIICDFYFTRDSGAPSEDAKAKFRHAFTRVVTDDAQWKLHLTHLADLADAAWTVSVDGRTDNREGSSALYVDATSPRPAGATTDAATRKRRRARIKQFRTEHDFTMADLARHVAMSVTAIEGMVRGDHSRYSDEKLSTFLKTIGVRADDW